MAGIAVAAVLLASLGEPVAAADVGGPDIVSYLNAQRTAHGVPAGIAEDPALSAGCAKHNLYGASNAILTHGEDPSRPGYTPEGHQAGTTSVLYSGSGPWAAARNPFETAPIHLHQLLAPRLDRMGASENQGYGCATTFASRNRAAPPADVTYTYPGAGATAWPPAQVAAEGPYSPGELVGIAAGTRTGPYLYVMFDGPDLTPFDTATATAASLTGPDGAVAVVTVDNHTAGLEGFLPAGIEIIPRGPLRANATYTASVGANVSTQGGSGPPRAFGHTWSFVTGSLDNAVRITQATPAGRQVRVLVASDAPGATVTATGPGRPVVQQVGVDGTATLNLNANGTWQLCARSGGGVSGYLAAEQCVAVSVAGPVAPRPPPRAAPKAPPSSRPFTVSVPSSVRSGRTIKLVIASRSRFSLRFRIRTRDRQTILRYPRRTLRADIWNFPLRVPAPHNRRGRSVRLTLIIVIRGREYTVVRRIRFR